LDEIMTELERSYQNEDEATIKTSDFVPEGKNQRPVIFFFVALGLVALGLLVVQNNGLSSKRFPQLLKADHVEKDSAVELNGMWFIDKYTASIAEGSHCKVQTFMNNYITDSTGGFMYFGCGDQNITTKVVSYLGGAFKELHWIDSIVYPDAGSMDVGGWSDYIYDLGADSYNVFMHNKLQLYVTDLSAHYATMITSGALSDHAVLRLSDSIDGSTSDVAHILVQLPNCGTFYEIVGPASTLTTDDLTSFTAWSTEECPMSHILPLTLTDLASLYADIEFSDSNVAWTLSSGMPVPMAVTIAVPTSSTDYIQDTIHLYTDVLGFGVSYAGDTSTCEMYTVDVATAGVDDYVAEYTPILRYVVNHLASQGTTSSLSDWETDITTTHTTYLSADGSTWDRYLDSHIGLFNYANDVSTTECTTEVDTVITAMAKYSVLSGPREETNSLHWYAGVKGLQSLELNMGCSANYSNVCGCLASNNDIEFYDMTGVVC